MAKRPLRPEDRNLFLCPGDPQVSPDGKQIAFVLQRTDTGKDKYQTDLYVVSSCGGEPLQLTSAGCDRLPRWSPDGKTIAFVSDRTGKPQIWLIRPSGGEAWCLSTHQRVSSAPSWAPNGKQVAFTSSVFSQEDNWIPYPGAPADDYERAKTQATGSEKASDVKVITRLKHRMDGVGYYGDKRTQVFVVDVPESRAAVGAPARQITTGDFDHDSPSWSPCGSCVAVTATRHGDADMLGKSDLWVVDLSSGETRQVLDASGPSQMPVWSPDGTLLAYTGHAGTHRNSTSGEVRVVSVGGPIKREGDVVSLSSTLDRGVNAIPSSDARYSVSANPCVFCPDGYVYFIVGSEGDTFVYRAMPGKPAEIAAGVCGRVISAMTVASGVIAYQSGSFTEPDEIFCTSPEGTLQLTRFNEALLSELDICAAQKTTYPGPEGWEISGWFVGPSTGAEKPPMVLQIHGGPHGVYGSSFQFQGQLLASNGISVLYANPRGSQGYGQDFARACVEDWGGHDYKDLMAGVDEIVKRGLAHPERLGITGWSYGGYMTCWAITQTQRFKAAITGACIANRHNFYGTSDIGFNFGEHHFGGNPWECPDRLLDRSAIKHIANVTTPVMILHGEADLRCPVEQAEQFFIALKRLGKHAVLVRYPNEYHAFKVPSHWQDRYSRVLSWFVHYLR